MEITTLQVRLKIIRFDGQDLRGYHTPKKKGYTRMTLCVAKLVKGSLL